MAVIFSINVCKDVPSTGTLSGAYGILHADPSAPSWFEFINAGVGGYDWIISPPVGSVGVFLIDLLNPDNIVVGQIEITSIECNPNYVHNVCLGDFVINSPIERPPGWTEENPVEWVIYSAPDWFNLFDVAGQYQGYSFVSESGPMTIVILQEDKAENYLRIEINTEVCFRTIEDCQEYQLNLAWLNRYGGWQTYIFSGEKTYGVEIGDTKTYKVSGVIRYESIEEVYDTVQQPSGYIPLSDLEFVKEMKYTIQAYEFNNVTELWDIPILIDAESFILSQEGNGFYIYNFTYKYATEIIVQGQ